MTPTATTAILRRFSEWRLTEDEALIFEIGEAIDVAVEMIERLEAAESDALEQARLNGMGGEREAALMAKLEAAEKERDALRVDKATLQQMLYSIKNRLEAAEKSDAESIAMYRKARDERDALRAKIEAMERQAPAMWVNSSNIVSARINRERGGIGDQHTCAETKTAYHDAPLYALPGAQGE